ncbi:hypothetical protein AB0I10_20695 [Streptomyces sp. NPDC050636]
MGKPHPSPKDKEKVREVAGRLAVALGARALWALIEKLFSEHLRG